MTNIRSFQLDDTDALVAILKANQQYGHPAIDGPEAMLRVHSCEAAEFLVAEEGGFLDLHGAPRVSWTKLDGSVDATTNPPILTFVDEVDWEVDDWLVVAGSEYQTHSPGYQPYGKDWVDYAEKVQIKTVLGLKHKRKRSFDGMQALMLLTLMANLQLVWFRRELGLDQLGLKHTSRKKIFESFQE